MAPGDSGLTAPGSPRVRHSVRVPADVTLLELLGGLIPLVAAVLTLLAFRWRRRDEVGGTMRPIFTTALRTLTHHEVARGSTLLNISQQIASSCGVAVLSVILTNHLKDSPLAFSAIASHHDPSIVDRIGGPAAVAQGLQEAAGAFTDTFFVAACLVVFALVSALFLPRTREGAGLDHAPGADAEPIVMH